MSHRTIRISIIIGALMIAAAVTVALLLLPDNGRTVVEPGATGPLFPRTIHTPASAQRDRSGSKSSTRRNPATTGSQGRTTPPRQPSQAPNRNPTARTNPPAPSTPSPTGAPTPAPNPPPQPPPTTTPQPQRCIKLLPVECDQPILPGL